MCDGELCSDYPSKVFKSRLRENSAFPIQVDQSLVRIS
jgi:hypothetical protein